MRRRLNSRRWFDVRDGVLFTWCTVMFGVGVLYNPNGLGGFTAGINLGLAANCLINRKFKQRIERVLRQDERDVNTLHMLCEKLSYDMLHKMEKSGMN